MYLFFLRHGIAEDSARGGTDADRALTDAGHTQLALVAQAMRRMDIHPSMIYTSPLVRTQQTAAAVAPAVGGTVMVATELAPGCIFDDLQALLRRPEGDQVLIVGHAPDMGSLAAALIGADERAIRVAKAGLVCVEYSGRLRRGHGTLRYALTPQQLEWLGAAT